MEFSHINSHTLFSGDALVDDELLRSREFGAILGTGCYHAHKTDVYIRLFILKFKQYFLGQEEFSAVGDPALLLLLLLAPLVLLPDLLFLARGEVVLDVERLSDLLWRLPFDHVGHRLAGDVQQALDVQVVGRQDKLEEGALVNL